MQLRFGKLKIFLLANIIFSVFVVAAYGQTTAFTYQGRLTDSSVAQPTNGTYDFLFKLFDAASSGNQQGVQIAVSNVQVANGIFTVSLDFGTALISPASNLFLEIAARPAGPQGPFTTLVPRQQITSAPFAVQALNAASAVDAQNLGGTAANQFVTILDPRLSDDRNPLSGSSSYVQNTNSTQTANFNISGNGTVGGTVAGNIVSAFIQFNLNGQRILARGSTNSLFAGVNAGFPLSPGFHNSFFGTTSGQLVSSGSNNSFFGSGTGSGATSPFNTVLVGFNSGVTITTEDDNTLIGANTDISAGVNSSTAIGIGAKATLSNTVVLGTASQTVIIPGLGAAGSTQLCRNASNQISTCSSSRRYKSNIASFDFGIDLINRLQPVTFNWRANNQADLGLVAEDVAKVEPLLVTYNENGAVEGVKYDRISVVLLNAVKQQQTQIKQQNGQIKEQQKTIDALKMLVCAANKGAEVCREQK